jgi:transposase
MEGTGVYWKAPFEALEDAGIHADLLNAQHVKQIRGKKTDASDSLWLARICQFGLALPSYVPPRRFRQLRQLTRYRRTLVAERSRTRNRVHKTLDHDGLRLGGILSDIFGVNGRRILDGLVAGRPPGRILADLTTHVQAKLEPLAQALAAALDPLALLKLQMQIETLDRADAAIAVLDTRIRTELAEYQRPLRLFPGTWSSGALRRRRYRRSTGSSRTTWLGPPRCSTAR